MEPIKLLGQGQQIITKSGKVKALITGVSIRGQNKMYEIGYFAGADYKQCWLYDFEFEPDYSERQSPGFQPPSNQLKISEGGPDK